MHWKPRHEPLNAFQHERRPEQEVVWAIYCNNFIFHEFIIQSVAECLSVAFEKCAWRKKKEGMCWVEGERFQASPDTTTLKTSSTRKPHRKFNFIWDITSALLPCLPSPRCTNKIFVHFFNLIVKWQILLLLALPFLSRSGKQATQQIRFPPRHTQISFFGCLPPSTRTLRSYLKTISFPPTRMEISSLI